MKRFLSVLFLLVVGMFIRTFTAAAVSAQTTSVFLESFDSTVAPAFGPLVLSADASWKTSTASVSPGSGANNAVHTGVSPGVLLLGAVDLSSASSGTFSYWARRTASYSAANLSVLASIDGGVVYDIVLFGGGLPLAASTYESISVVLPDTLLGRADVRLMFDARGGTSSGSNIRIDDVVITIPLNPASTPASFGFSQSTGLWDQSNPVFSTSIGLSWPGPDSIQGFQFQLIYDDTLVSVDSITTNPTSLPPSGFSVATSLLGSPAIMAVLNLSATGLLPGIYSDLLTVHFSQVGPALAADSLISVSLSGLIVTSTTPLAEELSLPLGERSFALTLSPAFASIGLSAASINFGSATVGDSTTFGLTIFNPTGGIALVVASFTDTDGFLSASLPGPIAPGDSALVLLRFTPTHELYGQQAGTLVILHNAPGNSTVISFSGAGLGGRGDADVDGAFDVADVILSLDASVSPVSLPAAAILRHDLHPFPAGNGLVDIRDVTVAIQAILRAQWPDSSALPVAPAAAGKGGSDPVRLLAGEDGTFLETTFDVRAIQLTYFSPKQISALVSFKNGLTLSERYDELAGEHRLIVLTSAGSPMEAGLTKISGALGEEVDLKYGLVVDLAGIKHRVRFERVQTVSTELPETLRLAPVVYPNPLRLGLDSHIDLGPLESASDVEITVFDSLGRRLFRLVAAGSSGNLVIPASTFSAAGLYFVRIQLRDVVGSGIQGGVQNQSQKKATTIPIIVAR